MVFTRGLVYDRVDHSSSVYWPSIVTDCYDRFMKDPATSFVVGPFLSVHSVSS